MGSETYKFLLRNFNFYAFTPKTPVYDFHITVVPWNIYNYIQTRNKYALGPVGSETYDF